MTLMHNLLSSGFNLSEMIHFLDRSKLVDQTFVTTMRTCLSDGQSLSQIFSTLQFSESVVTQVALSDHHGNLSQTLALITNNLTSKAQVRHKLIAVSTYPLILVVTLIVMMVGMKNYLLPQVGRENIASIVLHYLPTGILSLSGLLITAVLLFRLYFRKTSALRNFQKIGTLPCIGQFVKLYLTAFYAREWGNLIKHGLPLSQIVTLMVTQEDRLFREVGQDLLTTMQSGESFHKPIATYRFFTPELALIVEYGEMKAKLGDELLLYSELSWQSFFQRIDTLLNLIQPFIFLLVALMIVLIYAAMLLPIYAQMDVGL